MRILFAVAALSLCAGPVGARERHNVRNPHQVIKKDPRVAYVDDEPMSKHVTEPARPAAAAPSDDDGIFTHKVIHVEAPRTAQVGPIHTDDAAPAAREIRPNAERPSIDGDSVSGAIDLIAEKQMRKHQGEIDKCVAQAVKRHPQTTGTLELSILVGDKKVAHADVQSGQINDPQLAACLVKAAESWTFPLARAHFSHTVSISPSAAR